MSLTQIEPSTKLQFIIQHAEDRTAPLPVVPKKACPSDVGYDLTLIREEKKISHSNTMYDSGISVIPPIGYYIEIIPRRSLSKLGYIMANSIGIIDPDYRGTLKVALTKVIDTAEDIQLPCRLFQLILRKIINVDIEIHTARNNNDIQNFSNSTNRAAGSFGSTD